MASISAAAFIRAISRAVIAPAGPSKGPLADVFSVGANLASAFEDC